MALTDLRLALLAFAHQWDGGKLLGTLLLVPSGDPAQPLLQGATEPFQGTSIALRTALVPGTDSFARTDAASTPFQPTPPLDLVGAPDIFNYLRGRFGPTDQTAQPITATTATIRKALPASYTNLLPPGAGRSSFAASPDEFSCALKGQQVAPSPSSRPAPSWGEVISYALRNRSLASALGLSIEFTVPVAKPTDFANGGWLFVTLDASDGGTGYWNAWQARPDLVKCYAALLPPLASARPLFTPVLFPVQNPAAPPITPDGATLDLAYIEATAYSDGFAKLVHARQPLTADAATGADSALANPASDAGIQIGWDDEQVLEWHNRQIAVAQAVAGNQPVALEAPLGVIGYRIDVREPVPGEPQNPPSNSGWASLMTAVATVPAALQGTVPAFAGELSIEPTASIAATDKQTFWLPLYFAQWRGVQLGIRDDVARLLAGGVAAGTSPQLPASAFTGMAAPRLLYGHTYQFRVRLADLTGGGPLSTMHPASEASGQRAEVSFARQIAPKKFGVATTADAAPPPQPPRISAITLTRPSIAYPEALFTPRYGSDPLIAEAATAVLLAQLGYDASGNPPGRLPQKNSVLATGLPDPDVTRVRITVEARVLARDNATDISADGAFVAIYTTYRDISPLPAIDPNGPLGAKEILADTPIPPIPLSYQDAADIVTLQSQSSLTSGPLVLPTARDVRITLTPIGDGPAGYFGDADPVTGRTDPRVGLTSKVITRSASTNESGLFVAPRGGRPMLQALYFQPAPDGDVVAGIMAQMANQLGLVAEGLTLSGPPGERVVFGCSAGFKHQVAPDGSSLTFASAAELLSKWSLVYQAELARDWTWDGLAGDQLLVFGEGGAQIASIAMPRIASLDALSGTPDRSFTRIVLIHAIDPTIANSADGYANRPPVWLRARVPVGAATTDIDSDQQSIRLPVVVRPASNPEVVSAGYALSPFLPATDYSSTAPRERRLWLELKTPPSDGDGLFVRVLAYSPDPLLYNDPRLLSAAPPAEAPLKVDPELIRVITPGEPRDEDGIEAMTQLTAASDNPNRFLLPLPDGIDPDAPELFGLWTYELRFGHVEPWSTAHGRYSRPLRLAGVQHPAPSLPCHAQWHPAGEIRNILFPAEIVATAPYAKPVQNGQPVGTGMPLTAIGFLLYAQVPQFSSGQNRNILVMHAGATPQPGIAKMVVGTGEARFTQSDVAGSLKKFGLPETAPLSVLAVEFLAPGGSVAQLQLRGAAQRSAFDPFGPDFYGRLRILRTSPLVRIEPRC